MEFSQQVLGFLNSVASTVVWVAIGTALLFVAKRVIDFFDPCDYAAEIMRGNVAAAVIMAAYLLGLAFIIATIVRTPDTVVPAVPVAPITPTPGR